MLEHDPVLRLDDSQDLRVEVTDHPGGVPDRGCGDRLGREVDPTHPVTSSAGDHLHPAGAWPGDQPTTDLTQNGHRGSVGPGQAENAQKPSHACLVRHRVDRLLEQRVQFGVRLQHGTSFSPGVLVHRAWTSEEVLHVEGDNAHSCASSVAIVTEASMATCAVSVQAR